MVFQFNCSPCTGNDPTQDTVKVDPSLFSQEDKENSRAGQNVLHRSAAPTGKCATPEDPAQGDSAAQALAEESRRAAEREAAAQTAEREKAERLQAERRRLQAIEEARSQQEEKQRLEEERRRLQDEADARQKQEEAAAREAERLRQEKEAAEAAERKRQEQEEEERVAAQRQAAIGKAQTFLSTNKFANVNDLRKSTFKAKRPLHSAVKINDVETVRCLLAAGADPSLSNSAGKTPKQVAEELNKKVPIRESLKP